MKIVDYEVAPFVMDDMKVLLDDCSIRSIPAPKGPGYWCRVRNEARKLGFTGIDILPHLADPCYCDPQSSEGGDQ